MRPPWKFLAQLVSRRRPADASGRTIEQDGDRKLVEIDLQPAPALLLTSPTAVAAPDHDDEGQSSRPVETKAGTARETADDDRASKSAQPTVDVQAAAPTSETVAERPGIPPVEASKRMGKRRVANSVAADSKPLSQPPLLSADPFFDEAAGLDEDINHLREQLAGKLRLQNDQLRKMLGRFDHS